MWKSKYALAFYVGLILGLFGAAQQGVQILSRMYPDWGTIAGAFLIGLALFVDILPRPNQIVQPQVNVEQADAVNVAPSPDAPPPPTPVTTGDAVADDRPALRVPRSSK